MTRSHRKAELPAIPAKRYFKIGEVSMLCGVKQHVLHYWEREFAELRPAKREANRRYYQRHEVLLIRRIRKLLYEDGLTIRGARNQLAGWTSRQKAELFGIGDEATCGDGLDLAALTRELRALLEDL